MFPTLGQINTTPSEELSYFTNRVDELTAFNRILNIPEKQPIPVLMFYGVGGAGKSWMLKRLKQQIKAIPTVYLDLDPKVSEQSWGKEPSLAFAEIRRQLGTSIKCPRFDLAYTWLRYKEGRSEEPMFKGSGLLGNTWEFVVEVGSAAAEDVPFSSLGSWLVGKLTAPVNDWLSDKGLHDWLVSELGQKDFIKLKNQLPSEIYPELGQKLLLDLHENLPVNNGLTARAVVFLDTVEAIREDRSSTDRLDSAQSWLRELYHPESGLFVVIAGRDRLDWDRVNTVFASEKYLEQHLIGGLSKSDSTLFLSNCGITDSSLQDAILSVCYDEETQLIRPNSSIGYHPFSLGLSADTCQNFHSRGESIDPNSFRMDKGDIHELTRRFLRSMGGDGAYALWLKKLALTPQFDEIAAKVCFSEHASVERDAAWDELKTYSFFRPTQQAGWYSLHAKMREALSETLQIAHNTKWIEHHHTWQNYWQSLSENHEDLMAAKSWYHIWCTEPGTAKNKWNQLAKTTRQELRMADHYTLLDWWTPCEFDTSIDEALHGQHVDALSLLGVELQNATVGDRAANIQRAIECYEAALRVLTEEAFPREHNIVMSGLESARKTL